LQPAPDPLAERMQQLREVCAAAAEGFDDAFGEALERYRTAVREGVREFLANLAASLDKISGNNPTCAQIGKKAADYLEWLQWSFWDLPYFAMCMGLQEDLLRRAVRTCGMAYLSLRILDDVVDRHFVYKGRHATMLSAVETQRLGQQRAEGMTVLAGLLICFEGLGELAESSDPAALEILRRALQCLRRATIGALMEMSPRIEWSEPYYERMIALKNVDFWRALYTGIDPAYASPLYPFLERYYLLAQKLNDIQDYPEDEKRGQPNLVSLLTPAPSEATKGNSPTLGMAVPEAVERTIARAFQDLAEMTESLGELERRVARVKLGESLNEAFRLGLFRENGHAPSSEAAPATRLGLEWYSNLEDVVRVVGAGALSDAECAVCKGARKKRIFEKQGFGFYRCLDCGHIYVSPRISSELSYRMGQELDVRDHESCVMGIQKLFAAPICHLLLTRAPGPRLLDIGFGQGWVLQLARSYGFEPYGIETSVAQMAKLQAQLGRHLHLVGPEDASLPWEGFDAVVISHVLEHLPQPDELLGQIFRAMNPDGVLYAAVPDIESLQFQVFGRRWEVISPLAHMQYFNFASFSRLLRNCLFTDLERVEHAPISDGIAPRWMKLLRSLGGNDSGELAIVCRRPPL